MARCEPLCGCPVYYKPTLLQCSIARLHLVGAVIHTRPRSRPRPARRTAPAHASPIFKEEPRMAFERHHTASAHAHCAEATRRRKPRKADGRTIGAAALQVLVGC